MIDENNGDAVSAEVDELDNETTENNDDFPILMDDLDERRSHTP